MRIAALTLLSLLVSLPVAAQDSPAARIALDHMASLAQAEGFSATEAEQFLVTDEALDRRTGVTHVYLAQEANGIPVAGTVYPVAVAASGDVHSLASRFVVGVNERVNSAQPALDGRAALDAAEAHLAALPARNAGEEDGAVVSDVFDAPQEDPTFSALGDPRLVYQPIKSGALRLAWRVYLESSNGGMWETRVDAVTGGILEVIDLVVRENVGSTALHSTQRGAAPPSFAPIQPSPSLTAVEPALVGTYNVFPLPVESPIHGDRTLVADPADPTASPDGWHDTGSNSYTTLRGNNAWAYFDWDANNSADPDAPMPDGGAGLTFDFPFDHTTQTPFSSDAETAITNLFYWNNVVHDVMVHYGFDEAAGNFQVTNHSGEGQGDDPVFAEALDGSGISNANFATPPDGSSGRMQMFWWSTGWPVPSTNSTLETSATGELDHGRAFFGTGVLETPLVADIVLIESDGTNSDEGCGTVTNDTEIAGNIALVKRGECPFVFKTKNAYEAGAVGVIIYNHETGGDELVNLAAGTTAEFPTSLDDVIAADIPTVFVGLTDGETIRTALETTTVTGTISMNEAIGRDGSVDNGIVIHEYGHGISNRLTGGPSNVGCLNNVEQMGEGWSDYFALMLTQTSDHTATTNRGIATYSINEDIDGTGIRPAPYNTDFAVNDYTYGDIGSLAIPHGVGFVWATMLWEVTWDLIDAHGFDPDITNAEGMAGNQIALNLVMEGLKLQACSPGFVDGRDAILAAVDVAYSEQTAQWREDLRFLLWEAFARRGLGLNADQGSSLSTTDGTEDFTMPSEIAPDAITDLAGDPDGDFITLTWTAPDDEDSPVTNYFVRYATSPIATVEDWEAATPVSAAESMIPQSPGETEELVVTDLEYETTYHFSIRSNDYVNLSNLSNSAEVMTLPSPAVNIPTDPIEVVLPPEAQETVAYTISNAGPATLRYTLDLSDTTDDLERTPVPKPDPSGRRDASARDGVEDVSPAGEPQLMDSGGPDAFGYRWVDSNEPGGPTYDWIDITETGTHLELELDDHAIVDLPFDFPFYENTFDWVAVQSKGALSFSDITLYHINRQIPVQDGWNGVLAGYWDDLNPDPTTGGGAVYYDTLEDGRFVVTWEDVPHYPGEGSFTFQVILEPGGTILYQYNEMAPAPEDENSATVGIENLDGTDGLQVVYNAPYVEDGLAVEFTNWLRIDIRSGELSAGEEQTHTLTFSSGNLAGVYTADMIVTTNEQGESLTQEHVIPITLTIEGVGTEEDDVAFEGTHRLSAVAPNPISSLAQATLEVAEAQDVTVELFDVRGRKVTTPFEGSLAARTAQEIALDGSTLAPGVYVLRISGETFAETRRVTIVR